jgi:uncharacterized protein (TIGR02453 family)
MKTQQSATFGGFSDEGLAFLRGLARHNDREWFAPRKTLYEAELLEPLRAFVEALSDRLARERIPIGGTPQRSIYRIYRDIRFSPDKRPYKTHVSAYLSRDGSRDEPGGLYVHITPGESFIVAAFYQLDTPLVARWRRAIADDPKRFRAMLRALEKSGLRVTKPDEHEGSLKRVPPGFAAVPEDVADYLRLKSFNSSRTLTDKEVTSPRLVEIAARFAKDALPLFRYGWSV